MNHLIKGACPHCRTEITVTAEHYSEDTQYYLRVLAGECLHWRIEAAAGTVPVRLAFSSG